MHNWRGVSLAGLNVIVVGGPPRFICVHQQLCVYFRKEGGLDGAVKLDDR